ELGMELGHHDALRRLTPELRRGVAEEELGGVVDLAYDRVGIEFEHGNRRALGEEGELAAARLDLATGLLQLDQLARVGMSQPVTREEYPVQAVGDCDAHRVEERDEERDLGEQAVAEGGEHI